MQVKINHRGNGACPLCRHDGKCLYQKKIVEALADIKSREDFELVIYSCPHFKEKI
jgi:hypothetical protein